MPAKKATKPRRSIRYLLSADRRLQRLSLKKISERAKKATRPARATRLKNAEGAKKSARFPWPMGSRALALGVVGVVAGVALIAARQPAHTSDSARLAAPQEASAHLEADIASVSAPEEARAEPQQVQAASQAEPKKTVVSKVASKAVAATRDTAVAPKGKTATAETVTVPAASFAPRESAMASAPMTAAAESDAKTEANTDAKADVEDSGAVTIAGCVRLDGETFWLKDTSGADAPKSRSWKSGFLKKRSSSIELVDPTNSLRLRDYVGRRVAATGTLMDRELRPRSVRRVAASCD